MKPARIVLILCSIVLGGLVGFLLVRVVARSGQRRRTDPVESWGDTPIHVGEVQERPPISVSG